MLLNAGICSNGSRVADSQIALLSGIRMGLGHPLLRLFDPMRLLWPPAGRWNSDKSSQPTLWLDTCHCPSPSPSVTFTGVLFAALPRQTAAFCHFFIAGARHSRPLPASLPLLGRQLSHAHRQSCCRYFGCFFFFINIFICEGVQGLGESTQSPQACFITCDILLNVERKRLSFHIGLSRASFERALMTT